MADGITFQVTVKVRRAQGPPQDKEAIRQILDMDVEGLSAVWVQDERHNQESEYAIVSTSTELVVK